MNVTNQEGSEGQDARIVSKRRCLEITQIQLTKIWMTEPDPGVILQSRGVREDSNEAESMNHPMVMCVDHNNLKD
jgi:hypothetical protein